MMTTRKMMTKTRLRAGRSGVRFPNGVRYFSFLINALKLLWHTETFIKETLGLFPGVKWPRREVDF